MILLILATAAALIYWRIAADDGESWPRSAVKTASTAALALAGWQMGAPWLVTLGLALGAVGDFCLSRRGEAAFLAGMAAFGAAHLVYSGVFIGAAAGWPPLLPAFAMLILAASTEVWLIPRTGAMRWPVRGYVAVISLMALAAMALPPDRWVVQAGAALFVASDLMLAAHIFLRPRRALALTLWPAYWLGQALILWGSLPV